MRRRSLLKGGVWLLAGLAGCEERRSPTDTDGATPEAESPSPTAGEPHTPSPTDAPGSPTPAATPTDPATRYRPAVVAAGLVSSWSTPGDLATERIRRVSRGRPAIIAFRYRVRLPAGTTRFRESVVVHGHDGGEVAQTRREVHRTVEDVGVHAWEGAVAFDTTDWPTGSFAAVVRVGNLELHRVSEPFETTFRVEP